MIERRELQLSMGREPDQNDRLTTLALEIDAAHREFKRLQASAIDKAIEAGAKLLEAKALVPYGEWLAWLGARCHVSVRSAELYMSIAKSLQVLPRARAHLKDLPLTKAESYLRYAVEEYTRRGEKTLPMIAAAVFYDLEKAAQLLAQLKLHLGSEEKFAEWLNGEWSSRYGLSPDLAETLIEAFTRGNTDKYIGLSAPASPDDGWQYGPDGGGNVLDRQREGEFASDEGLTSESENRNGCESDQPAATAN
ncbi:MAG TPA: DUF3102 domain-containing protein [Stellaceae bacterium]|nr:DUF3102 domain-containing protein [Stellaceae bacterium]